MGVLAFFSDEVYPSHKSGHTVIDPAIVTYATIQYNISGCKFLIILIDVCLYGLDVRHARLACAPDMSCLSKRHAPIYLPLSPGVSAIVNL